MKTTFLASLALLLVGCATATIEGARQLTDYELCRTAMAPLPVRTDTKRADSLLGTVMAAVRMPSRTEMEWVNARRVLVERRQDCTPYVEALSAEMEMRGAMIRTGGAR